MMNSYDDTKTIPLWDSPEQIKKKINSRSKRRKKEIVLENVLTGVKYSCKTDYSVILGRQQNQCDLQLSVTDRYMSGIHMRLTVDEDHLYAEDMNSTNGSFLNNQKLIKRQEVRVGDRLKLGHSEFRLIQFL